MSKLENTELIKVTIRLYVGDKERLDELYPEQRHNFIIRELIHKHIKKIEYVAAHRNAQGIPTTGKSPETLSDMQ